MIVIGREKSFYFSHTSIIVCIRNDPSKCTCKSACRNRNGATATLVSDRRGRQQRGATYKCEHFSFFFDFFPSFAHHLDMAVAVLVEAYLWDPPDKLVGKDLIFLKLFEPSITRD